MYNLDIASVKKGLAGILQKLRKRFASLTQCLPYPWQCGDLRRKCIINLNQILRETNLHDLSIELNSTFMNIKPGA
jgi:hypothetical protein